MVKYFGAFFIGDFVDETIIKNGIFYIIAKALYTFFIFLLKNKIISS